jgi:transmembrane sensor
MIFRRSSLSNERKFEREAAQWLARRDRGLLPSEQDEYLQWLQQDQRRGAAIARHEATVRRMMQLASWQPGESDEPNPDLFRRPRRRYFAAATLSLAAAAALMTAFALWPRPKPVVSTPAISKSFLRVNERQTLPDGSTVLLNDGSHIKVEYSPDVRRVRLVGGEAHFVVTKNPARPFLVHVGNVVVRAVGTAFNVRLGTATVDVVVTEGSVRVEEPVAVSSNEADPTPQQPPVIAEGFRAVVDLGTAARDARVLPVTPVEMEQATSWQQARLQFFETPLSEALEEFNRHSAAQQMPRLVASDATVGALRIGGSCRVNNIDAFVRMLEVTFNLRAEKRGMDEIVLCRER